MTIPQYKTSFGDPRSFQTGLIAAPVIAWDYRQSIPLLAFKFSVAFLPRLTLPFRTVRQSQQALPWGWSEFHHLNFFGSNLPAQVAKSNHEPSIFGEDGGDFVIGAEIGFQFIAASMYVLSTDESRTGRPVLSQRGS
jgi:hypothetical protein